jgi:hypothetical protein
MDEDRKPRRLGWPTESDGSFTIPAGEENYRRFVAVATEEQIQQALDALQALPDARVH